MNEKQVQRILDEVTSELEDATKKFGAFSSTHHGYAVILEELDELWECVKSKESTTAEMRAEAVQVAAMAIRFIADLVDYEGHP